MTERRRIAWRHGCPECVEGWFLDFTRTASGELRVVMELDDGRIVSKPHDQCRFVRDEREVVNK